MYFFVRILESLRDFPPLFFRLILSYGFFGPAMMKLKNFEGIVTWFEGMNYWLPKVNAYLVTGTEVMGVFLLFFGLLTRLISIPLMVIMCVAIVTVHLDKGFQSSAGGFEIPLYYLLMLFSLAVTGGGRISLDHLVFGRKR